MPDGHVSDKIEIVLETRNNLIYNPKCQVCWQEPAAYLQFMVPEKDPLSTFEPRCIKHYKKGVLSIKLVWTRDYRE